MEYPRFTSERLAIPAEELAPRLIGSYLIRAMPDGTRLVGRITETEAYLGPKDRCSHAVGGRRTARNESMYARAGTCYVYFTYGMHFCMNVVCGGVDEPVAVLLRSLEPIEGLSIMRALRGGVQDKQLCNGPGKICQALGVDRSHDGVDLTASPVLWLSPGTPPARLVLAPRVGVGSGHRWAKAALRWYDPDAEISVRTKSKRPRLVPGLSPP